MNELADARARAQANARLHEGLKEARTENVRLHEVVMAADELFYWIENEHPAVMREVPTALLSRLRRATAAIRWDGDGDDAA